MKSTAKNDDNKKASHILEGFDSFDLDSAMSLLDHRRISEIDETVDSEVQQRYHQNRETQSENNEYDLMSDSINVSSCHQHDTFLSKRSRTILNPTGDEANWLLRRSIVSNSSFSESFTDRRESSTTELDSISGSEAFYDFQDSCNSIVSMHESVRYMEESSIEASLTANQQRNCSGSNAENGSGEKSSFIKLQRAGSSTHSRNDSPIIVPNGSDIVDRSTRLSGRHHIEDLSESEMSGSFRSTNLFYERTAKNERNGVQPMLHNETSTLSELPIRGSPSLLEKTPPEKDLKTTSASSNLISSPLNQPRQRSYSSSSKMSLYNLYSNMTVAQILDGNGILVNAEQKINYLIEDISQESCLLYMLFENFSSPSIGPETCSLILDLEREQSYEIKHKVIPFPEQPMILQSTASNNRVSKVSSDSIHEVKCPVVSLLQGVANSKILPVIMQLPVYFSSAILRILIRLLTHETNAEYNESCLLTYPWKDRFSAKTITLTDDPMPDPDHSTQRPHLQYSVSRFLCKWLSTSSQSTNKSPGENDNYSAILSVLNLWERLSVAPSQYHRLIAPVSRLIGLLSTAGVTPRVLRRMMILSSQQHPGVLATPQHQQLSQSYASIDSSVGLHVFARLCLVRALRTAAAGASRSSLLPKSSPLHYFSFSGRDKTNICGLTRTINGLSAWPFRNDFGMAVWFRAEHFPTYEGNKEKSAERIILFSVRTDEGGGIEISLVPLDDESATSSHVRTISVSVYDSKMSAEKSHRVTPTQEIKARAGCVLLPHVWYHVAVRHTRARLKGVFSLATRQQLSIMLDGKVMLTEPLGFPNISDSDHSEDSFYSPQAASTLIKNSFRRISTSSTLNITLVFGHNFEGQTGTLYVFNDNVSDATFRSLYEMTGGISGTQKRTRRFIDSWDTRHSDIVRKSRVLDVSISNDDAEEIVLSQRKHSGLRKRLLPEKLASVFDFGEGDEQEETVLPVELQKSSFGSKIFISWNPKRTLGSMAIELHVGAHVTMNGVWAWKCNPAQDVIGSLGGVQSLIAIFRSFLGGDIERGWSLSSFIDGIDSNSGTFGDSLCTIVPDLIRLLSVFVQDHSENARELLRCGGIDVIEQLLYNCKRTAVGKGPQSSIFAALASHPGLSYLLVDSLLNLCSACSHYVGLETKVYSRLIFNIPLWLVGFHQISGVALHVTLLPVLSSLTKLNPEKVRDCVGLRDMVQAIKEYAAGGSSQQGNSESVLDRFSSYNLDKMSIEKSLSPIERRHAINIVIAMIFIVLSRGTSSTDLSPFLQLISFNLELEWEEFLLKGDKVGFHDLQKNDIRIVPNACMALMFLLQVRPCIPGLYESFAQCCGGVQNASGWILCSLINSHDDEISGLGIRCLAEYLDIASRGVDVPLSFGAGTYPTAPTSQPDVTSMVRLSSTKFTQIAKGLAAMSPGVRSVALSPSRLTARVVYKLLWHLLKSRRGHLGPQTRAALLCWITMADDLSSASDMTSSEFLRCHLIVPFQSQQSGFRFSYEWANDLISDTSIFQRKSLRNPMTLSTILRLLRFLDSTSKDQWLSDIFMLLESNRKNVALLASLPDWQPSLFPLVSETLESVSSAKVDIHLQNIYDLDNTIKEDDLDFKGDQKNNILKQRLDRCISLYSTLLGHLFREGGDQALEALEKTASLERTCVNGHDVLLLILGCLCGNIFEHGTLLETGSLSAQDFKDVDLEKDSPLLRQSARLVTDAILSNGIKGLDMPTAVRSWRGLRHLTEVVVAVVTKSGFGTIDLFDYAFHSSLKSFNVDRISGGLHGIRLPETKLSGITASEYASYISIARSGQTTDEQAIEDKKREVDRRLCVKLAAQVLNLLDAFIFPHALEEVLHMPPMHSIALVRNSEVRLGTSQGPLISSAIRLSFVLLALVEPCSLVFLQCASRLRCLLCWALELLRESSTTENSAPPPFHKDGATHIDRLILSIVLHCHRALGRCASVLSEIESSILGTYFDNRDTQKKIYRRVLRVSLELREVISTAYRGRNDFLRITLTIRAYEALRTSLEGSSTAVRANSKEGVVRNFLTSSWVSGFQNFETKGGLNIPEQVSMHSIPLSSKQDNIPGLQGFFAIEKLAIESTNIVADFEKALDYCFKDYLEQHQRWTETDAVRDLEYEGDSTIKRFSDKFRSTALEASKVSVLRRGGAENRSKAIFRKVSHIFVTSKDRAQTHWKLARHTDILGRRTLLVPNQHFVDHKDASYDLPEGKDHEPSNQLTSHLGLLEKEALSEVMRRNTEAFVFERKESADGRDDDSTIPTSDSESVNTDAESSVDTSAGASAADTDSIGDLPEKSFVNVNYKEDPEQEEGWDKIDSEEIKDIDEHGDLDAWAKTFIWSDNEISVARFDMIMIVSLQTVCEGKALLTTHGLYFHQIGDEINIMTKDPVESSEIIGNDGKMRRWRLTRLTEVHGRRFMLRSQALELFFSDSHELLLNFPVGVKERDRFYSKLRHSCKVPMLWSTRSLNPRVVFKKTRLTEQWRKRKITNFEYLLALNRMAGRSFSDLTQYPVFPWIIADYTSETIDLTDPRVFRDLSKPVGALNADRLSQLLERYKELELFGFSEAEKFLYGSHYSSPGIVLHYLIRMEPFTTMAIDLQSGRFDCPDRLFHSISESWNSCLTSTSDMKELVPEFFSLPEMFLNINRFPLGTTQSGRVVDNVQLPPWAKGSAFEFIRLNRMALESEYVSQNLHHWIDLVFGYKQRGPEAARAHNIFHQLSYEGAVDLDKMEDLIDRQAAETHIQNFGQTPGQLTSDDPHPIRLSVDDCWKPLLRDQKSSRNMKFHTPAKQFANKRTEDAKGSCLKIHVFSDFIIAIYEDMSIGSYKWFPGNKTSRLRMDKLKPLSRRELSTSRVAMKRGSALSADLANNSNLAIGSWSFCVTLGGLIKEELRRKAVMPSARLISTNETSLTAAEASALVISCGYWDETVKAHCTDGWRLVASETGGHRGAIRCVAIGDDGGLMVTGGQDGTCRVWVIDHPDMVVALSDGYVQTSLGRSNFGDQLLSCCHILWGHDTAITCIAVDSDLDAVISGSQSGLICVHTLRRGEFVRSFQVSNGPTSRSSSGAASKIALGNNGNFVVQMEDYNLHTYTVNAVRLCSVDAGEKLHEMVVSTTGQILVTGGERGHLIIRNMIDLQICTSIDLSRFGPIRCIALTAADLNPIAQFLFVGSDNGMITIVENDPVGNQQDSQTTSF